MLKVEFVADIDTAAGYAAHARAMIKAMHNTGLDGHGIDLKLLVRRKEPCVVTMTKDEIDLYRFYADKEIGKPDVRVFFEPAQWAHFEEGVKTVIFSQWETTKIRSFDVPGKPSLNWKAQMNSADLVLTSAESAKKAYEFSGVTTPIHVIPGPIIPVTSDDELPIAGLVRTGKAGTLVPREKRPIVIGYMAQWCPRKNVEAFIRDVTIGFKQGEVLGLVKTYKSSNFNDEDSVLEAGRIVKESCRKVGSPDFIFLTEKLTDLEVEQFFNSIDIYYCPSRGEGFNVPAIMAASKGIPVIAGRWGGHADFLPPEYLVDGSFSPAIGMGVYDSDQFWFNVDEMQAIDKLQALVDMKKNHPENFSRLAEHLRVQTSEKAGSEIFVRKFVESIKSLCNEPAMATG